MKSRILVALVAVLAMSACTSSSGGTHFQFKYATKLDTLIAPADREPAQNIGGTLLDGGTTDLRSDKGKVVLLNFWASWCVPCQVETPQLEQVYESMHAKGVNFLGIDTKDIRGKAKSFVGNNGVTYPVLYDENGESALRLGNIPGNLPFTVLIDKKGRVAAVYLSKLTENDLTGPLHTLLAEG
jgi:thiol-disulfide isomerase/thioredoxin